MNNRIRTISTKQWCEEKNIEIDKKILENNVRGIYGLFINYPDRKKCVYIGKATNIIERLYEHFSSVKWLIVNVLSGEAPEHVIILAEAIQNDYVISAELLEKVEYEYNNYNRDLHHLYDFCVEEEIDDLEGLELEQIQRFEKIVEQKVVNVKNSMQIIDNSRKILFLTAPEIHWHANVWYMERFHLSEDRLNPSNPVQRLSFIEVTNKKNRELLQEYAKYHVGIGGLTIANIRGQLYEVKRLLEYFKEEESICQVDENQLDDCFRKLEEKDTKDDTFNKRIVHYIKFYQFLNVRGYMKEIPFKPEYYLKKTYPEHHDRTVEEKVYMEILHKLYAFPLVPRLIFLHLWCTGLRISEVCTLKGDAYYWDGEDAWLKVYQIKMKADKMIPIPLVMYRIMRKYIEREHIRPKDYIFKGKDGGAYRGTTFRQEFQQYCDKNGIADGSYIFKTHDYRHTLATQFYDEDVSIQTIRDYLGHFSEEMTKQYVDFMPKRIEKASDIYFKKPENDLASTIKAKKRGERK